MSLIATISASQTDTAPAQSENLLASASSQASPASAGIITSSASTKIIETPLFVPEITTTITATQNAQEINQLSIPSIAIIAAAAVILVALVVCAVCAIRKKSLQSRLPAVAAVTEIHGSGEAEAGGDSRRKTMVGLLKPNAARAQSFHPPQFHRLSKISSRASQNASVVEMGSATRRLYESVV
ncbi:hypothetical protein HK100_002678 [Physocladia obscura]|uniref:Uncharacterized protein n=1 Tax=Physocladia obscura TaxID=109957 RepID=A0AAD5SY69_9FUNG|nr:hypothetical protein HK100_002678 [Physocladia obscura]